MTAALIILAALVAVGAVLYAGERSWRRKHAQAQEPDGADTVVADDEAHAADGESEVCCGMHITCEKDSLLAAVSPTVEYYDDEELDAYRGLGEDDYTEEATEEFRDVLLTLLPSDIAGWARSLQLRGITLPAAVRQELLMIVAEARREHTAATS